MLVKLTPEQVAEYWNIFRPAIRATAPPQVAISDKMTKNILKNLLAEKGYVWIYAEPDFSRVYGLTVTTEEFDPLTESTSLLIWGVYSFGGLSQEMIEDGLKSILKFAEERGLPNVIAYSDNEQLVRFLESLGAESNNRLIKFSV